MLYPAELRPHIVPLTRESTNKAVLPQQAIRLFNLQASVVFKLEAASSRLCCVGKRLEAASTFALTSLLMPDHS